MPKKIRELKSILMKAGFTYRPGKGSHTDQEKDVRNALQELENLNQGDNP
jgi:hypothetical protein